MAKGGAFERDIAKELGRWWAKREDVFWRSHNSGGRATQRYKKGNTKTAGQHGDICATDPIGKPFTDIITLEIKRGYPRANVQDIIDAADENKKPILATFFTQAIDAHNKAGSHGWALLQRRDRRIPWLWLARHVWADLKAYGAFSYRPAPFVMACLPVRVGLAVEVVGMPWSDFLLGCKRKHFEGLAREL